MFHRQVYIFLMCLIYFLELVLCFIFVPFMCIRMEAGQREEDDRSDLILLLEHFAS